MAPTVQCFIGYFPNSEAFSTYIDEHYVDNDEDEDFDDPISKFCEDQGVFFIDHDFMESQFIDDPSKIKESLAAASYAESFVQAVITAYESAQLPGLPNCQIYLYEESQLNTPKSIHSSDYWLYYLGAFKLSRS